MGRRKVKRAPRGKGRGNIAARLAYLIDLARQRAETLRPMPPLGVLAHTLEVHKRTVRRDLQAMEAAHIPFLWHRRTEDD